MQELRELRADEREPLSDADIQLLIGPTKICRYPDLRRYQRIEEALDSHGRVVVLYLIDGPASGHWQLIHVTAPRQLEMFGSYGEGVWGAYDWTTAAQERALGQTRNEVARLLADAQRRGWKVVQNRTCFQSRRGDIATCGRHVCARALLHDWPLERYTRVVLGTGDPDLFVTCLTEQLEELKSG